MNVIFTDIIAFVELGTGLRNWGRLGHLHFGIQGADGRREYKELLAYERIFKKLLTCSCQAFLIHEIVLRGTGINENRL